MTPARLMAETRTETAMEKLRTRGMITALTLLMTTAAASAQDAQQPFRIGGEIKFNLRDSAAAEAIVGTPFPPEFIPPGQTAVYERTVAKGSSLELQNLALIGEGDLMSGVSARFELHVLDLYNRNSTTEDDRVFVRDAWIKFHSDGETPRPDGEAQFYLLAGQAARFSKERFRRLESYGLWGTAVGRFEERQVQFGGAIGSHAYWRLSVASSNPLFFRDPNALAGDNGTSTRVAGNVHPVLESGFPILYDAKAQDLTFNHPAQWGFGGGGRWVQRDSSGKAETQRLDVLGWYFRRSLADSVPLRGTFYSGDIKLLTGVPGALPISGNDKIEWGANVEYARGGLRVFGQGVRQEIAGLPRQGYEIEAAYVFETHGLLLLDETPAINWIQPVLRVSSIDNRFVTPHIYPAPSVGWDWKKYDMGVRIGIVRNVDVTAEFTRNSTILETGEAIHPNEGLVTLRIAF
jgi:hypothetical protein